MSGKALLGWGAAGVGAVAFPALLLGPIWLPGAIILGGLGVLAGWACGLRIAHWREARDYRNNNNHRKETP
jgi:hypothetical protein